MDWTALDIPIKKEEGITTYYEWISEYIVDLFSLYDAAI